MVILAVVYLATLQPGPPTMAEASTVAGCRGPVAGGCVEVRITATGGHAGPPATIRELQMNVCHSGVADCFQPADKSTIEAAGMIDRYQPTVVTLNEICASDIVDNASPVPAAMLALARRDHDPTVFALFTPAVNKFTGLQYRCVDGDMYGIGIIGRGTVGQATHHVYRDQLATTDEERVAICAPFDGNTDICTTHLESDSGAVALGQCRELLGQDGYLDQVRARTDDPPTIVAGDFNLRHIQDCAPADWSIADDDGVQQLTTDLPLIASRTVPTHFTDHPALVTDMRR